MQTRKHPRTMQEAFGPYCNHEIQEARSEFKWTPVRVALCLTYAAAIVVLVWVI